MRSTMFWPPPAHVPGHQLVLLMLAFTEEMFGRVGIGH